MPDAYALPGGPPSPYWSVPLGLPCQETRKIVHGLARRSAEELSQSLGFCHDAEWAGRCPVRPGTPKTSGRVTVYFAALLARTEDGWEASDTELDDVETLTDLADLAREATADEDTVLVLIEQEDAWFGVVRVDGEDDPRVYVSDATAAARSSYGEILLTDELLGRDPDDELADLDALDLDGTEDGEDEDDNDGAAQDLGPTPSGPVGEAGLLTDFGISEAQLLALGNDGAPGEALSEIADALGCGEVLESVR
jgi:putative tRNA adenosine deaminase-associated protein